MIEITPSVTRNNSQKALDENNTTHTTVVAYCAASENILETYKTQALKLGELLAQNSIRLRYGAGNTGLMFRVAQSCMEHGGHVVGIVPQFMVDRNWTIEKNFVSELIITETMHERKQLLISGVVACIALPGGVGTLEELLEAITWKQLGLFDGSIIVLNTMNYFDHLIQLLGRAEQDGFVSKAYELFRVASTPEEVIEMIHEAVKLEEERKQCRIRLEKEKDPGVETCAEKCLKKELI
ncbi:hypothetical protein FDP41_005320 [Naegleria fowleri]|uniref:Cytokinin riboside 5'-monophosphate phosphoribohydrolase n=1 Tax=Naegleria fowleri TaxID=5763 RepID=A0A6A5BDN2_NAEFO|nr:uncharacterized protein FDP41_005320 [Naegleria fowleri]KAF0975993.1 hypothetical protein FDP41_005320 [Naegleria fowleri]CAG4717452.1 unnamed protein product [Naegleria fowleri]